MNRNRGSGGNGRQKDGAAGEKPPKTQGGKQGTKIFVSALSGQRTKKKKNRVASSREKRSNLWLRGERCRAFGRLTGENVERTHRLRLRGSNRKRKPDDKSYHGPRGKTHRTRRGPVFSTSKTKERDRMLALRCPGPSSKKGKHRPKKRFCYKARRKNELKSLKPDEGRSRKNQEEKREKLCKTERKLILVK